jgi:thiamine biosynthesis lipoprotein
LNQTAQYAAVPLSDTLWTILLDCRRYYEATDGFFDITKSDFKQIEFMEETHSVLFNQQGITLDFGGYGKGYALRCMRNRLEQAGIHQALINFGSSSVLAMGVHPYGDSWPVGIDDPSKGISLLNLRLCDTSLSVSGNTPARPSHILNPKTSEWVTGERMVAIVADDPVDAEALTTAWIASGMESVPDWMKKFNLKNTYRIK